MKYRVLSLKRGSWGEVSLTDVAAELFKAEEFVLEDEGIGASVQLTTLKRTVLLL